MITSPIPVILGIFALSILASPPVRAQSTPAADTVTLAPSGTEIQPPAPAPAAATPTPVTPAPAPATAIPMAGAPPPTSAPATPPTVTPAPAPATATPTAGTPAPAPAPQTAPLFRAEQLDQLLAPIALYPDALLAQILMAATYPLEIVKARRWFEDPRHTALQGAALAAAIEAEGWDPSIKALMAFPQILRMMDANLDWTEKVGDAFLGHQADVMDAIQRLRLQAASAGTLWSNAQQRVTTEGQGIVIEPASPAFIYPPVYNPADAYGPWPYPDYPPLDIVPPDYGFGFDLPFGIGFGAGFAVARPLWRWCAFDWAQRRILLDVDGSNVPGRTGPESGSAVWQHDPAHRDGVAYLDSASRERFGGFRDHAVSAVAFPRVDIPNARVVASTGLSNPATRRFRPAWTGPVARIQQGRGVAGRQFLAPQRMPRQPILSMTPRALALSRAAPAGGNPRFEGISHR